MLFSNKGFSENLVNIAIFSPNPWEKKYFNNDNNKIETLKKNIYFKYNFFHYKNIKKAESKLFDILKDETYKSIIAMDFIFTDLFFKYSKKFPKVNFLIKDSLKSRPNLNNYRIKFFEPAYLISKYQFQKYKKSKALIIANNKTPSNLAAINSVALGYYNEKKKNNIHLYFLHKSDDKYNTENINNLLKNNSYKTVFLLINRKNIFKIIKDNDVEYFSITNDHFNDFSENNIAKIKIDYHFFVKNYLDHILKKGFYYKKNIHIGYGSFEQALKIRFKNNLFHDLTFSNLFKKLNINNDLVYDNVLISKNDKNTSQIVFRGPIIDKNNTIKLSTDEFMNESEIENIDWIINRIKIIN